MYTILLSYYTSGEERYLANYTMARKKRSKLKQAFFILLLILAGLGMVLFLVVPGLGSISY